MPKTVKGPVNAPEGHALRLIATLNGKAITTNPESTQRYRKPADEIKKTSIAILLSIEGNDYCKGQYALATLSRSLKDHNQVFCIIGDELQKYNLEYTRNYIKSSITSSDRAILLGNQYLENTLPFFLNAITKEYPQFDQETFFLLNGHKPISKQMLALNMRCERLNIPLEFIRWKEWEIDPRNKSAAIQQQIKPLFNMPESKLAIELEVAANKFAGRRKFRDKSPEEKTFIIAQSKRFVREESLVIAAMLEDLNVDYCAYAGKLPPLIKLVGEAYKTFQNSDVAWESGIHVHHRARIQNQLEIKFKREVVPLESSEVLSTQSDSNDLIANQGRTRIETHLRISRNYLNLLDQGDHSLTVQIREDASCSPCKRDDNSIHLQQDTTDLTEESKIAEQKNEHQPSKSFYSIHRDMVFFNPEEQNQKVDEIQLQNFQYDVLLNALKLKIATREIPSSELGGVVKQLLLLAGSITDLMIPSTSAISNSSPTSILMCK